jgi:hypothetical protein
MDAGDAHADLPPEGVILNRMRQIERFMRYRRERRTWTPELLAAVRTDHAFLDRVFEAYPPHRSPIGGMAYRLVSELGAILRATAPQPEPAAAGPPKGSQRAKAAWLRQHLASGIVTPDAVAAALAIRPNDVAPIAAGTLRISARLWAKLGELVERRVH